MNMALLNFQKGLENLRSYQIVIGNLRREMKRNRCTLLAKIGNILPNRVCLQTFRKEVHDLGLNNCIVVKKSFLNHNHKVKRLVFAKEHSHWTLEYWSKMI